MEKKAQLKKEQESLSGHDPIDGTKSFIVGMPTYSNLIGYGKKETKLVLLFP